MTETVQKIELVAQINCQSNPQEIRFSFTELQIENDKTTWLEPIFSEPIHRKKPTLSCASQSSRSVQKPLLR